MADGIDYATGARLRPWSRIWRYAVVTLLGIISWLAVYASYAVAVDEGRVADQPAFFVLSLIDVVVFLVAVCLLPLRRRAPVAVAVVTALLSSVSAMTASGPAQLAAVSNATHRRWFPIVLNGAAFVTATWVFERLTPADYLTPLPWWATLLGSAITFLIPVGFGLYIGARRALVLSLHDRAVRAEHERELQVQTAQAAERTRIAREMHDVLAHRISLVAMHAGALSYRPDLTEQERSRAVELVQDNARRALAELRQVLGVLRTERAGVEPPQPTLSALSALIEETREAGVDIDASGTAFANGAPEPDELVSRTAFRIVQEALTNARKHAPGATVRVQVDGRSGGLLTIEVVNGAALRPAVDAAGSGLGLAGLIERAELAGGSLEAGADGRGGFAVRAWLPWEDEADG